MHLFKKLALKFFLIFFTLVSANALAQTGDPRISKDLQLLDLGSTREALSDLKAMTAATPRNPEAHAALALAMIETGDIASADKEVATAYDQERKNVLVHIARGTLYGKKGKREDAVEEFNKAIKLNDKDIASYLALAHYYISIDSLKPAEIKLYNAEELAKNDVRPFIGLAELYEKQHAIDLAIEQYQDAKKIDPNNITVTAKLAQLYFRTHKYNEAIKEWDNLTKIDSNYARAYLEMAKIYDISEDHVDAAKYAEKYVQKTPDDMEGIWLAARSFAESNQYQKALPYLKKAATNDSLKTYTDLYLARSYFFTKEYPKAIALYSVSKSLSAYDLYYYGFSQMSSGDTSAALDKWRAALAADTNHKANERLNIRKQIISFLNLKKDYAGMASLYIDEAKEKNSADDYISAGQFYNAAAKPAEARSAFDAALKINPKLVKAKTGIAESSEDLAAAEKMIDEAAAGVSVPEDKETIGNAYARLGFKYYSAKDYENCARVMEEKSLNYLTKASPYLIRVYKALGAAYIQTQNFPKAKEYYKKSLEINPNDEDAKKGLDYLKQVGK